LIANQLLYVVWPSNISVDWTMAVLCCLDDWLHCYCVVAVFWLQTDNLTCTWFNPRPSGCIGPHFDVILICFELPPLLPPRWFPSLTSSY